MKTEKTIFIILGVMTLLVFAGIIIFSLNEGGAKKNPQVLSFSKNESDRPKVLVGSNFSDLGQMKVSEEKSAEFSLENTGEKPLSLFNIKSSCDCTSGQVVIGNSKSPEFSMMSNDPWIGELKKGEKATIKVIYRPQIMPVKGVVTRDVYVSTNDPDNPKLTFTIKAFVD